MSVKSGEYLPRRFAASISVNNCSPDCILEANSYAHDMFGLRHLAYNGNNNINNNDNDCLLITIAVKNLTTGNKIPGEGALGSIFAGYVPLAS